MIERNGEVQKVIELLVEVGRGVERDAEEKRSHGEEILLCEVGNF